MDDAKPTIGGEKKPSNGSFWDKEIIWRYLKKCPKPVATAILSATRAQQLP